MHLINDWKGKSYHGTSPSNHSKGVSILFRKQFEHEIINHFVADDGKTIIVNFKHNGNIYSTTNLYASSDPTHRKDRF